MTTRIRISSYRRIDHAEIQCAPIALLAGINEAGKSSLSEAIQAALTGETLLKRLRLPKKDAAKVLNGAAKQATAALIGPDGQATVSWPGCEFKTEGTPPHASAVAAGLVYLDELDDKGRAELLGPYLKASPTKNDVTIALQERFKQESIDAIWKEIERDGWDACHARQVEARRDAGRDWQKVTGENFGSDKAANWSPQGWRAELDETTGGALDEAISAANRALEEAIRNEAVDQSRTDQLTAAAAGYETAQKALTDAQLAFDTAQGQYEAAKTARAALPPRIEGRGTACPHEECGRPIQIGAGGVLQKFVPIDTAENKKRGEKIAAADGAVSRTEAAVNAAKTALNTARAAFQDAERAKTELASLQGRTGSAEATAAARATLERLRTDLQLVEQSAKAEEAFISWTRASLLIGILEPDGLRKKTLGNAVEAFNAAVLAPICESGKFAPVTIDPDLIPHYRGRPYTLISTAALYRLRRVLQIALAKLDGSAMVVMDGADVLDSEGRNGLFEALIDSGLEAVVTMTTVRGASVPDLQRADIGNTYEIANGRTAPLGEKQEAA